MFRNSLQLHSSHNRAAMISRLYSLLYISSFLTFWGIGHTAIAQLNSYIQAVRPLSAEEGAPLSVTAALANTSSITRVVLYYRQLGATDFRSVEMQILRDSASVVLAAGEIAPPFLEIYVWAETRTGQTETYPASLPQSVPARITILPRSTHDAGVLILSPDADEVILPEDVYISLSFVYAPDVVDMRKTKIFLNALDISSRAMVVGDLMIIASEMIPDELKRNTLALTVQVFDTAGALYATLRRSIVIKGEHDPGSESIAWLVTGSAQAESRSEYNRGTSAVYNRLDMRANSTYGILRTTANIQLTSEEHSENQAQNRYFVGFDTRFLTLGLGDTYPQMPSTLMDGSRVRGISLNGGYGAVHVSAASGEIVRETKRNDEIQTYRRTLTVVRPSFATGEHFQFGFSYLHAKDDWSEPVTLKPRENIVAGTDISVLVDDRHIEWTAQASMSMCNMDISSPAFTTDSIDAAVARGIVKASDGDALKHFLPIGSRLITINENIFPLNPSGLSSLACETALSVNYFNNYIRGTYIFHGNNFLSFGATSFRNDIQGYNISDRVRLANNTLFVTGSIEELSNNVSKYNSVTTKWSTLSASVSYFGASGIPDMTIGWTANTITNDAPTTDTTVTAYPAIDFATNRFFVQSSYAFTWIGQHNAMVSLDYTNADDRTMRNQDMTGFNGMMTMVTSHSTLLESTVGISTSLNTLPAPVQSFQQSGTGSANTSSTSSFNYTTLTLGVGYALFDQRMKASALVSPTFGDVRRTQLEARTQYTVFARHTIMVKYHYIVNSSLQPTSVMPYVNDSAFTISYRMSI